MTRPAVTIGPDEPVTHAARLMYNRRVKRLPVIDDDGTLIGIVTRSDVLSVYSRPDARHRHEITQDLILGTFLATPPAFTVTVKDGIVTLDGHAGNRRRRPRHHRRRPGTSRASSPSATGSPTRRPSTTPPTQCSNAPMRHRLATSLLRHQP